MSVTMDVPSDGSVVLILTGDAIFFGENTVLEYGLGSSAGGLDLHITRVGMLDGSETDRDHRTMATVAIVSVTEGLHTFYATDLSAERRSPRCFLHASLTSIEPESIGLSAAGGGLERT